MLAKFIILVAILALIKPAVSIDVSPRAVNLDHDLCLGEAKLYRECGSLNVVAAISKRKNAGFESVKNFGAMAIDIPQGCKATLYNEKVRFAVHITGPKIILQPKTVKWYRYCRFARYCRRGNGSGGVSKNRTGICRF